MQYNIMLKILRVSSLILYYKTKACLSCSNTESPATCRQIKYDIQNRTKLLKDNHMKHKVLNILTCTLSFAF